MVHYPLGTIPTMANPERKELVARGIRPDSRKRLSLGAALENLDSEASFDVYRDSRGRIILEPQISIPAAEAWLFRNKQAKESVARGLEQSGNGETEVIGSFAKYVEDDEA